MHTMMYMQDINTYAHTHTIHMSASLFCNSVVTLLTVSWSLAELLGHRNWATVSSPQDHIGSFLDLISQSWGSVVPPTVYCRRRPCCFLSSLAHLSTILHYYFLLNRVWLTLQRVSGVVITGRRRANWSRTILMV